MENNVLNFEQIKEDKELIDSIVAVRQYLLMESKRLADELIAENPNMTAEDVLSEIKLQAFNNTVRHFELKAFDGRANVEIGSIDEFNEISQKYKESPLIDDVNRLTSTPYYKSQINNVVGGVFNE